jgi:hypothetical protein
MSEFNYVVYQNGVGGDYRIAKVIESPTFKPFELDPTRAYDVIKIHNKSDYPGLFDNDKCENSKYLTPFRKVMCRIDTCDFCEKTTSADNIHQEYTDLDNHLGYFYCNDCKDDLIQCLKQSGVEPIWYIRERYEKKNVYKCSVWVERSRRDDNGEIINYGPYTFEKWQIYGWYANMIIDKTDNVVKPHIICEGNGYIKTVPVEKILKLNPLDNPDYNPNDDPIYK